MSIVGLPVANGTRLRPASRAFHVARTTVSTSSNGIAG